MLSWVSVPVKPAHVWHVLIWRGIQSLGLFKAFCTAPPSRPVHSNTISTYLRNIQPCCNYCAKNIRSNIRLCLQLDSFIQLSELWQRGMTEIAKASKRQQVDSNPMNIQDKNNLTAYCHNGLTFLLQNTKSMRGSSTGWKTSGMCTAS